MRSLQPHTTFPRRLSQCGARAKRPHEDCRSGHLVIMLRGRECPTSSFAQPWVGRLSVKKNRSKKGKRKNRTRLSRPKSNPQPAQSQSPENRREAHVILEQPQQLRGKDDQRTLRQRAKRLIVFVGSLIGLASAVVTLWPAITVEAEAPLDLSRPQDTTFKIKNVGVLTLANVEPALGICRLAQGRIEFGNRSPECNGSQQAYQIRAWPPERLSRNETLEMRIGDFLPANASSGEISIIVYWSFAYGFNWISYLPVFTPFEFAFYTRKEADGKLIWRSRPLHRGKPKQPL